MHIHPGMCSRNRFHLRLFVRKTEQKHDPVPNTLFLGNYRILNSNCYPVLHQFEEKHPQGDLSSAHSAMFYYTFLFRYALYPYFLTSLCHSPIKLTIPAITWSANCAPGVNPVFAVFDHAVPRYGLRILRASQRGKLGAGSYPFHWMSLPGRGLKIIIAKISKQMLLLDSSPV